MKRTLHFDKDITRMITYGDLSEVIRDLTNLQEQLISEGVDLSIADIDLYDGRIGLNYKRPETDAEYESRLNKEQYLEQQKINEELQLLKKLKAKYETNT